MADEIIRLVHIDGTLPNLALMKLGHWNKSIGNRVILAHDVQPSLFEPRTYHRVYGSAIFKRSRYLVDELLAAYPDAVVGGTGSGRPLSLSVEAAIGVAQYEHYDYELYPHYPWSLGFTQRGCRMPCRFCVVPKKEGKPISVNMIADIWRPDRPRAVDLLDNDFFGQPEQSWRARIDEILDGDFRVSFSQGVNVRLVNDKIASVLASVRYYNRDFTKRRLYMAWDNIGDERVFFRGVERLKDAGVPTRHMMVYMLIGFAEGETMEGIMHRYQRLKAEGCMPYPMVFEPFDDDEDMGDGERRERTKEETRLLKGFQRWVVGRFDHIVPWEEYRKPGATEPLTPPAGASIQLGIPRSDYEYVGQNRHEGKINQDMCEPEEIEPEITRLEHDLQAPGWRPVEMMEPTTGMPFTRWFPPVKSAPPVDREIVGDNMMRPPNLEHGPEPRGDDY